MVLAREVEDIFGIACGVAEHGDVVGGAEGFVVIGDDECFLEVKRGFDEGCD